MINTILKVLFVKLYVNMAFVKLYVQRNSCYRMALYKNYLLLFNVI